MRRQNKQVGPDHLGRRLTAAALAVVMGAGCVTVAPFQAKAESGGDTGYQIYPNPHVMEYTGDEYIVRTEVNVVFETGIDQYTKDRLAEVLELKKITTYTTSDKIDTTKTNILVGIEGSGQYVDTYADEHLGELTTTDLFDKTDSYVLDNQDGVITVLGRDTDAAFYGLTSLYHVFTQMDSYTIQEFRMEDWADVASRGFIEGYYGNPWSTTDRVNLMTWAGYYKLNSYFYAPKDDPKHNANWRSLYTETELEEKIAPLAQAGNASKCQFVYALHPFMKDTPINASNYDSSLEVLKKKFQQTMDYGVRQIAVLADDAAVPGGDNEAGWKVYTDLMKDLTDWVSSAEMQEKYPGLKVVIPFCPNNYMGNGGSAQLQYLGKNMPETVPLVVTGGTVWGEVSQSFTQNFKNGVGRGPYMWINWPCTDNSKNHLIMGGYDDFLQVGVNPANIQGIVLNPMQQSEPSKVAIFGNACYSWNIWENKAEADKAWEASFACVDHNTAVPNAASDALRELSKHMINQNMPVTTVRTLQESVELKPILNAFKAKLTDGSVMAADVDEVMEEFEVLQQAAVTYRNQAGNTDVMNQIIYWLDCWDDTTEAAIAYLNGVKAVISKDTNAILQYNTQGKTAFERSKNHPLWYLNHYQYAEVGVQHIVPFINTLASYVSQYAETAMDPSKVITTLITNRTDTPTGSTSNIFDGSDSTGITYKTPNAIAKGEYVGLMYNKVIDVNTIRITMQEKADHFQHCKLQYTVDGKEWKDVELRGINNQFDVPVNNTFKIELDEAKLLEDFRAMGVRLITTQANSGACWLDLREFQINQEPSTEAALIEGEYSASDGLRIRDGKWTNLKDGSNSSEIWLSNTGNEQTGADQYILYTFTNTTQIGEVHFAQGASANGDVITKGKLQYQDENDQWHDLASVTNALDQTFDFNGQGIVAKAIRIYNSTAVSVWWRVGEFTVRVGTGSDRKPIEYNVIRSDRWILEDGYSEENLYDGSDNTYAYYDPDGGNDVYTEPKDTFDVNEYLGYNLGKVAELASIHLVVGNGTQDKLLKYAIETSLTGKEGDWQAVPGYAEHTGVDSGTDVLNITLAQPIKAQYIRVRNLEQRPKWGFFGEFTVTEAPKGSTENLYTNVETSILSNKVDGQVSLTSGSVTLNADDYIGVDLGNIKAITGVTTSDLPKNVTLQTSMNGVSWTDYTAATDAIDARYVRAVSSAAGASLALTKFEVNYEFIGDKAVESNFDGASNARDMRTKGNVNAIFDGKLTTYAELAGPQTAGKYVTFDLGQTIDFESLRYYIVETQYDFPRHVKFEVSEDGETNWQQVLVVGNAEAVNKPSTTTAKDSGYLTHDSTNPGNMYAEATNLNVSGRYLKVTVLTTYADRWLAFSEIQINGGAYISPETNQDIVSETVEQPGHIPSYALDGNYSTTYKPSKVNSSFTYRISEPVGLTSVRLVQLGAASNATVTANFASNARTVDSQVLGTLSQAINEFVLPAGKTLESITVTWKETIPEIAEIGTSTQTVKATDKTELNQALNQAQDTNTWTTDSVKAYETAKAEAERIVANDSVTQTMVDAALGALNSAINSAVRKATNVADLEAMVDDMVSNDAHIYTTVSYLNYSSAVQALEIALKNADNLSQTKADQLKAAVETAKNDLVYSTYNKEVAQMTVESYEALAEANYTQKTFDDVTAAKKAIEALLSQDDVTPMQFVEAVSAYQAAVDALADTTLLKAEIDKAATVDEDLYTAESYQAYMDAVAEAEKLLTTGTKAEVEAAVANIRAMFQAMDLNPDTELGAVVAQAEALNAEDYTQKTYEDLMALVDEAKADPTNSAYIQKIVDAMKALVNVKALNTQMCTAEAVEAGKFTTSSYKTLADLMGQVEALMQSGTQAQVDEMVGKLDAAIRGLVARASGVDEYRDGITLKPADGYTADSYAAYKEAYEALMNANADDLSAEAFAQLKADLEVAELALKAVQTDKPSDTQKPSEDNVPPTGDTANLMAYVLVAAVCAAGIAALMFYKNKKKA